MVKSNGHISDVKKLSVLGPYSKQILCQYFYFDCFLESFQMIRVLIQLLFRFFQSTIFRPLSDHVSTFLFLL